MQSAVKSAEQSEEDRPSSADRPRPNTGTV